MVKEKKEKKVKFSVRTPDNGQEKVDKSDKIPEKDNKQSVNPDKIELKEQKLDNTKEKSALSGNAHKNHNKQNVNPVQQDVDIELLRIRQGFIEDNDRKKWIDKSEFNVELKQVQQTIERLNSFFVWNGRSKAKKIKEALNRAIDVELKTSLKFTDFKAFKKYKCYSSSSFFGGKKMPSLSEELSEHRLFKSLNKFIGKAPKSKM